MSLIFLHKTADYRLALWQVTESLAELAALCLPEEVQQAENLTAGKRRQEWLAWRALVQHLVPGVRISYDKHGAPVFADAKRKKKYLSVTHAGDIVGVLIANQPCGIDLESATRDYRRACMRFIASDEDRLIDKEDNRSYARLWCAKEVLYKWAGLSGVNLRDDIRIIAADPMPAKESVPKKPDFHAVLHIAGEIRGESLLLNNIFFADQCLVWGRGTR